jgi:hypothetical protein
MRLEDMAIHIGWRELAVQFVAPSARISEEKSVAGSKRQYQVSRRGLLAGAAAISIVPSKSVRAQASEPLLIGFLTVRTGPLAAGGKQQEEGAATFLKQRGGMIAAAGSS